MCHVDFHYHHYITYGHPQQCGLRVVLYAHHLCLPGFLFKDIPKNIFINCTGHYSSLLYGWFGSTWQPVCDLLGECFDF